LNFVILLIHDHSDSLSTKIIRKIIDGGLKELLGSIGWGVKQIPPLILESSVQSNENVELPFGVKAKNCAEVGKSSKAIRDHTFEQCKDGNFPLILGGDHCIAIGTISAIKKARKDAGIVWVRYFLAAAKVNVITDQCRFF
jgi:hypothetical protein